MTRFGAMYPDLYLDTARGPALDDFARVVDESAYRYGRPYERMDDNAITGWRKLLASWNTGIFKITIELINDRHSGTIVVFSMPVLDRETGHPSVVTQPTCLPPYSPTDPITNEWIRNEIRRLVLHEIDEQITVNQRRIFDPHKEPVR